MLCCICSEKPQKTCLTCSASFCGDHVKHHYTAPALQKHTLVDAGGTENRFCSRHNRIFEMFCLSDQTAICISCMIDHSGHNLCSLAQHELYQVCVKLIYDTQCEYSYWNITRYDMQIYNITFLCLGKKDTHKTPVKKGKNKKSSCALNCFVIWS